MISRSGSVWPNVYVEVWYEAERDGGGAYLRVVGVVPTALVEEETMLFFSLGDARIVVWTLRSLGSMSDIVGCCGLISFLSSDEEAMFPMSDVTTAKH